MMVGYRRRSSPLRYREKIRAPVGFEVAVPEVIVDRLRRPVIVVREPSHWCVLLPSPLW